MTTTSAATGEDRAWGWLHHLRGGGTTPWADWSGTSAPTGAALPGAQHLELLRRLNQVGPPDPLLAERVLAVSAPGRGQLDLELVGVDRDTPFGPRPVDPATIATRELVRVATALIAEDLLALGPPAQGRAPLRRPFRTRYRMLGDPELAGPLRRELTARGRPPGGSPATVVVLGTGIDRMLAHAWTHRAFGPGVRSWRGWLERLTREDQLPASVDLLSQARRAAGRTGASEVHVVLDPGHLAGLVGVRQPLAWPPEPAAAAPDLARQVSAVLGMHCSGQERVVLLRQSLRPLVATAAGPSLVLPRVHLDWARERADELASGLRRAGYVVHGGTEALRPDPGGGAVVRDVTATLLLAMRLLLRPAGRPGAPRATDEEGV